MRIKNILASAAVTAFGLTGCTQNSNTPYLSRQDIKETINSFEDITGQELTREERRTLTCVAQSVHRGDVDALIQITENQLLSPSEDFATAIQMAAAPAVDRAAGCNTESLAGVVEGIETAAVQTLGLSPQ